MPSANGAATINSLTLTGVATTTTASGKFSYKLTAAAVAAQNSVGGLINVIPLRSSASTTLVSQNPVMNGSIGTTSMGFPVTIQGPPQGFEVSGMSLAFPSQIAATSTYTTNLLPSLYFPHVSVGITSTQAGTLNVQRYIDKAGTVAQGSALTATLTANTAAVIDNSDGKAFGSYTIQVINSGSSPATLSGFIAVLLAK